MPSWEWAAVIAFLAAAWQRVRAALGWVRGILIVSRRMPYSSARLEALGEHDSATRFQERCYRHALSIRMGRRAA